MADNSTLNPGVLGDVIRDIDKSGVKTQVVTLDVGGAGAESLVAGTVPVSGTVSVSGVATAAKQDTGNTSVASIDTKTPALGQALAAASVPVVLTAAQITTLTPVSTVTANAGTNLNTSLLALETGGNLAAIKTDVDKIPSQGQALAAASMPVVLTAIQQTALTPPAAITGFALEAGNLATLVARQPALGAAVTSASSPVNIASDQTVPISAASLPLPSGAATGAMQTTMQTSLTALTNLVDQNAQIIKLLSAILITLGNNGNGFVQPEEATELSTLQ